MQTNKLYAVFFLDETGQRVYVTKTPDGDNEITVSPSLAAAVPVEVTALNGSTKSGKVEVGKDYFIRQYDSYDSAKNKDYSNAVLWLNKEKTSNLLGVPFAKNNMPLKLAGADARFHFTNSARASNRDDIIWIQSMYKDRLQVPVVDGTHIRMDDPPDDSLTNEQYGMRYFPYEVLALLKQQQATIAAGAAPTQQAPAATPPSAEQPGSETQQQQEQPKKLEKLQFNVGYLAYFVRKSSGSKYYVGVPALTSDMNEYEVTLTSDRNEAFPIFFTPNLMVVDTAELKNGTRDVLVYQFTQCVGEPKAKDRVVWTNIENTQFLKAILPQGENNTSAQTQENREISTAATVAKYMGVGTFVVGTIAEQIYKATGKKFVPTFIVEDLRTESPSTKSVKLVNSFRDKQILTVAETTGGAKIQPDDISEHENYVQDPELSLFLEPFVVTDKTRCKTAATLPSPKVSQVTIDTPYLVTVTSREGTYGVSSDGEQVTLLKDNTEQTAVLRLIPADTTQAEKNVPVKDGDKVYVWLKSKEDVDKAPVFLNFDAGNQHIIGVRPSQLKRVEDKDRRSTFEVVNLQPNSFQLKPVLLDKSEKLVSTEDNTWPKNSKLIVSQNDANKATFTVVRDLNMSELDEDVRQAAGVKTIGPMSSWYWVGWVASAVLFLVGAAMLMAMIFIPAASSLRTAILGIICTVLGVVLFAVMLYTEGTDVPEDAEPVAGWCQFGPFNTFVPGCGNAPSYCIPGLKQIVPNCSKN